MAFSQFSNNSDPKVAILITDGKSNEQQAKKLLEEADKKNITIYTIGLGEERDKLNEDLLKQLAYETGGQYYHAKENIDISEIYQTILAEITCGYPALTCTSASSASDRRRLNTPTPIST